MEDKNYDYPYFRQNEASPYHPYYHPYFYSQNNIYYNYVPSQHLPQRHHHPNFKSFIEEIKKKEEALKHEALVKFEPEGKLNKVEECQVELKEKEISNTLLGNELKLNKICRKIKYFDINVAPTITSDHYAMVEDKEKEIVRKAFIKKRKDLKINEVDYPEEDSNPFIIFKNRRIKKKFKKYVKDEENLLAGDKDVSFYFIESSVEELSEGVSIEGPNIERSIKNETKNEDLFLNRTNEILKVFVNNQ